jgi:hypothetical protein
MNFQEFTTWCKSKIAEHPTKKQDIIEFHSLAHSEIADGGSEQHEIDLAMNDINELINQ